MTTQDFIAKFTPENEGLVAKMQAVKTPEEAYAVARAEGLTDSFEDFVAGMTAFYAKLKDLSESDLEMVAGGELSQDELIGLTALTAVTSITGTFLTVTAATLVGAAAASI
jgi:hypothetical protein